MNFLNLKSEKNYFRKLLVGNIFGPRKQTTNKNVKIKLNKRKNPTRVTLLCDIDSAEPPETENFPSLQFSPTQTKIIQYNV